MIFKDLNEQKEFERTTGKQARLKRYKQLVCDESIEFPIDSESIDRQAFSRVCLESGCKPKLFRAELTGADDEYWKNW